MLYFLPEKSLFQILLDVFGIGMSQAQNTCHFFGLKSNLNSTALSNKQKTLLLDYILKKERSLKGEELKQYIKKRKKLLTTIRNFRGIRITSGLPVRGQRTKTNKKTANKLNR